MCIVVVPPVHVLKNFLKGNGLTFFGKLLMAAARTFLGGRGEKNFHIRVRQDYGADVTAIHNNIVLGGDFFLQIKKEIPHAWYRRHSRSPHRYLGSANLVGHVLSVQKNTLFAVHIFQLGSYVSQKRFHSFGVAHVPAP